MENIFGLHTFTTSNLKVKEMIEMIEILFGDQAKECLRNRSYRHILRYTIQRAEAAVFVPSMGAKAVSKYCADSLLAVLKGAIPPCVITPGGWKIYTLREAENLLPQSVVIESPCGNNKWINIHPCDLQPYAVEHIGENSDNQLEQRKLYYDEIVKCGYGNDELRTSNEPEYVATRKELVKKFGPNMGIPTWSWKDSYRS